MLLEMGFLNFLFLIIHYWYMNYEIIIVCILTLYPVTLLNSLILNLVETLRFSIFSIMSSVHSYSFISSLLIWVPFISFSCLITLARVSNSILNRNCENGIFVFFLILEEKCSAFQH